MSTLWTPSGEHPVEPEREGPPGGPASEPGAGGRAGARGAAAGPEDASAQVEELRRQLATTPASVVVANHCYGLFELATVYLSQEPPLFPQAQLAIDAMGALIDGLGDRLDEAAAPLRDALAQIRLAFVQLAAADEARRSGADGTEHPEAEPRP